MLGRQESPIQSFHNSCRIAFPANDVSFRHIYRVRRRPGCMAEDRQKHQLQNVVSIADFDALLCPGSNKEPMSRRICISIASTDSSRIIVLSSNHVLSHRFPRYPSERITQSLCCCSTVYLNEATSPDRAPPHCTLHTSRRSP